MGNLQLTSCRGRSSRVARIYKRSHGTSTWPTLGLLLPLRDKPGRPVLGSFRGRRSSSVALPKSRSASWRDAVVPAAEQADSNALDHASLPASSQLCGRVGPQTLGEPLLRHEASRRLSTGIRHPASDHTNRALFAARQPLTNRRRARLTQYAFQCPAACHFAADQVQRAKELHGAEYGGVVTARGTGRMVPTGVARRVEQLEGNGLPPVCQGDDICSSVPCWMSPFRSASWLPRAAAYLDSSRLDIPRQPLRRSQPGAPLPSFT